ncbi:MAG TPA: outer membrane protein assembly factor BamD [Bacteroidetes bacterium]|nr:outer membrane protein assembly factor BamD [Bacteroidota bacterium]HIL58027.1 outer membrane protein assembly factor BamD [Rhodothermales bacterium]
MPHRSTLRRLALASASAFAPVLPLAAVSAVAVGCGSAAVAPNSAQEAYDRGVEAFDRGRYVRAIEHFRTALDFGRTSPLAADAQFYLARAYAEDGQYLLAGNEFTRFIEFYRSDARLQQAAYERILAYAALSPDHELDQTDTERAIDYIRLYLSQYPESDNADAARALLDELREKLALKRYDNGRLYERRELFEAAMVYYESVLQEYPTSEWADDALIGSLRAQIAFARASVRDRQTERYAEALAKYDRFITLFPNSPHVREAEGLYEQAFQAHRSLTAAASASAE